MVSFWISEIQKHALEGVVKVLVGNQIDKEERLVSKQEGKAKADELGVEFFETSAKTGQGIEELFRFMAINTRLVEDGKELNPRNSVKLKEQKGKKKCCDKS